MTYTMEEILKVKEKYEESLRQIAGVTGVGAKTSNGSIIIYVKEKTKTLLSELPTTLNGIPVTIIKTGTIVPLFTIPVATAVYTERTGRYRPAPGGVSVGHPEVTAGTLTCQAIDKQTGEILGLSNNHVLAASWGTESIGKNGDPILQPGPYDGGKEPADMIGSLDRWIPVKTGEDNLIDAAAFKSEQVVRDIKEIGKPDSPIDAYVGMKVVKSGRTSGVTYGEVIDTHATITVSGWGDCTFKDQITTSKMLDPGDSGSWVGNQDTYRTVGIGHAGSPNISVTCKAKHVEDLLNLQIIPPTKTLPWYTVMGIWGSAFSIGQVLLGVWKLPKTGGVMI